MEESEWGDPRFASDDEFASPSDLVDAHPRTQPGGDALSSFSCCCTSCEPRQIAQESQTLGGPPEGPLNQPSALRTSRTTSTSSPLPALHTSSSSTSKETEGLPVSILMLQYPLFFCDVDLPFTLELKRSWREIGGLASWTLSSAKEGNGVQALRDNSSISFWQSEGQAPHTVTLQFNREMPVTRVDLLVNFHLDESYTPKRIQIKMGSSPATLSVVRDVEFVVTDDQNCWWGIELTAAHAIKLVNGLENHSQEALDLVLHGVETSEYLRAACLQIAVLTTHQQGRDTHIRQVRIYGPIEGYEDPSTISEHAQTAADRVRSGLLSYADEGAYGLDLAGEGTDTPHLNPRETDMPALSRAWSQDFLAALAGTQPAPP
ncbi:uncharacterized protein LOC34621377 [Cyclospora cayetanensis]|uniref:Uncharacterized protein LOC34621377 n=1 Tax=Cyclospora cayetanensis TaxID=88456 RepID=A0A6P6RVD1_9EIME|nr:uncharacterized protein LOC34621377 [Cyclospora cayetanensis]